ncbi:hypothetical protein [Pseudovibrio sp. Tun.PSC04-5.I4]|nr:hypothetical protein [Pseudovibrio sp. Tun.PSC04-5.I4]SDQ82107.1 hypothetical protein SAMN04515695_1528 [Pseudovibrio sp. Tun.PSC04-5.I4]
MKDHAVLYAGTAVLGGLLITASAFLWMRYGNLLFSDKLLNALAGCFGL